MSLEFQPGQTVEHPRLGAGVVIAISGAFARVFFQNGGEQTVETETLRRQGTWEQQVLAGLRPATEQTWERLLLAIQARALPLDEGAATLTAAKVDLLPHQLVLTHRVATAPNRRFLIADDVGLGKTVEAALVLRELASRGELTRALMVVPAGLLENWRRELNDVFHLDFEVFGDGGDISDRVTNAFARHNRIIASIDTLKRPSRVQRLAEAPAWDLVVFDEAQHLTALRSGNSVKKSENYKLAEVLRRHCRDLLLLSATPHQGDHFRFLALVRLLDPTLFRDERDMLENRHRLNAVMIRRTKADACRPDGSPLFARRQVHTQFFDLSGEEQGFYSALTDYINDGYNLAKAQSGKGRALGFVMTVFQKIASSSFAAVRHTLERRLLSLTLHEALARDALLDVPGRDALLREALQMVMTLNGIEDSPLGRAEAERLLAEARLRLMKRLHRDEDRDESASEAAAAGWEEAATLLVEQALPEERQRIGNLLQALPSGPETKTLELLRALGQLWQENPTEKIIIFTTYLGSVDTLQYWVSEHFPQVGVEILKGGDHGAKLAAERRFRRMPGPRVLICTAAGREGINLQFARIIINHDLPWNPMDLEQRIGRIHRYGQIDTAQIYNLVSGNTIEGRVYLMLETKIRDVARALGKVNDQGEIAEDLRMQVLGQLGEQLSFSRLYQEALSDPTLQRTAQELEAALRNASQAREVVHELFQDLDAFRLEEYNEQDSADALERLRSFVELATRIHGGSARSMGPHQFAVAMVGGDETVFTTDREAAMNQASLAMLGLEHPIVVQLLEAATSLPPQDRALITGVGGSPLVRSIWEVRIGTAEGHGATHLFEVTVDARRLCNCRELLPGAWQDYPRLPMDAHLQEWDRLSVVMENIPNTLRSYLTETGHLPAGASYAQRLLAWVEAPAT